MLRPSAARCVIRVHESPGEQRAAVLLDGVLTEFFIDRPASPDGLGDIHVARLTARVPAMAGSFLAIHDAEAFLPDSEGGAGLTEGDWVTVRVTRAAQGGKGPRVSAKIAPAGNAPDTATDSFGKPEGPVRLLRRGPTALAELRDAYPAAPVAFGPYDDALESAIAALDAPYAVLAGGVRALFSVTPALTAIDLDGAGATASRNGKQQAQLAANLAALPELGRQIVLRNVSGAILVDFAGMPSRKRKSLGPALETVLAQDRLAPRLAGFSHLGFAEIERRRLRPPLHEKFSSAHGIGLAALRQAAAEMRAAPSRRLALRAGPAVVTALEGDGAALAALAREAAYPLVLRRDAALGRTWFIEDGHA